MQNDDTVSFFVIIMYIRMYVCNTIHYFLLYYNSKINKEIFQSKFLSKSTWYGGYRE